jgi:hypothetical protein
MAIIGKAHEMGYPSIALAQAFQTDCWQYGLTQKDVIGEWVPKDEAGLSAVLDDDGMKWLRGLRWNEIDKDLVLRHPPSRGGKIIECRLSECQLIMAEFKRLEKLPPAGPVIVSEVSWKPWQPASFRKQWRDIANACDIPRNVFNAGSGDAGDEDEGETEERELAR